MSGHLTLGEIFERKYELQEILGHGGFSAVYRATDVSIGRDVAIKILTLGDDGYAPGVVARFMREARVIGAFQDPHTITMFDFGRSEEGLLYMVFEYVAGKDLSEVIRERGALRPDVVAHILDQVLQSLKEAHSTGVLHRDIKPANILVYDYMGDEHRVKLLDFGIAKLVGTDRPNITRDGGIVGTPRYMAPEQILGRSLTPASDLYSLGLVAYEMLVGEPVIRGDDAKQIYRQQLSDSLLVVPRGLGASEAFCRVIDLLAAKEQTSRMQSVDDALRALRECGTFSSPDSVAPAAVQDSEVPTKALPDTIEDAPDHLSIKMILGAGVLAAVLVLVLLKSISLFTSDTPVTEPIQPMQYLQLPQGAPSNQRKPAALEVSPQSPPVMLDAGSPDASESDASHLPDTLPSQQGRPPTGCGQDVPWTGDKLLTIMFGGQWRSWFTYLPRNYHPDRKYPVVVLLHPTIKDGQSAATELALRRTADRRKFIIVAPNLPEGHTNWPMTDAAFVRDLIEEVAELSCVDRSRVYVINYGLSSKLARYLPCKVPLSALALVLSGIKRHTGPCEVPTPTIAFRGKEDPFLPLEGGRNCIFAMYSSLEEERSAWRQRQGCLGEPKRYSTARNGRCETWKCESDYVSCTLDGGNRFAAASPQEFQLPGCRGPKIDYPVAEEAWRFFRERGVVLKEP